MARLEATASALAAGTAAGTPAGTPAGAGRTGVPEADAVQAGKPVQVAVPLLEPKLLLPRLHQPLVERSRLLARLDTALEHKLTVLTAPAGFGKTTLVRQWIAGRRARGNLPPVAWVSLDAGDNDPVRFWRYVITACQAWPADGARSALTLLSAAAQPPFGPSPVETVLTAFLNALTHGGQGGILVLEDYHVISAPAVHKTLAFFLDHLPAPLHLVILSRQDPPLPLARLRARGDLCEVHGADLRFSPAETRAFLQQTMAVPLATLSPETADHLETRLEGWAAGLRLLAVALQGSPQAIGPSLATLACSHRQVLDYFVTEVLDAQPEPLQHFLLQTSFLGRLTGSLCDAVLDRQGSEMLLDALERAGLFLERLDGPELWYRYHALFAEAMSAEAHRRLGSPALQALSSRASRWYEQQGMVAEAIEAALAAGDMVRAAGLVEQRIGNQFFGRMQEFHTLRRWLEQVPAAVMQSHPALCLGYAIAVATGNAPEPPTPAAMALMEGLLQTAEDGWRARGNTARLGEVFAFRALAAHRLEKQAQAVALARQALVWLPEEERTWRAISLTVVAADDLQEGRLDSARRTLLEVRALWEAAGNRHGRRSGMVLLGAVYFGQGELHLATEHCRQALTEAREVGDGDDIGPTQLGLAQILYEWNELEAAGQAAQEAYDLGVQLAYPRLQVQAALMLVRVQHAQGQTRLAQQRLAALMAQVLPQREPQLYREVLAGQAQLLLALGDRSAAARCLTLLAGLGPPRHGHAELLAARLLLAEGRAEAALDTLRCQLAAAQAAGRTRSALEIQLLMARAQVACQHVQAARELLQTVLSLVHTEGYVRLFLDEGAGMAALLRSTLPGLRERPLTSYVRNVLSAFVAEPEQAAGQPFPSDLSGLIEPLSPQEQRVLRLLATGLSNPELARELVVSVNTVKAHVKSIYRKLNVNNRREAAEALRHLPAL